QGKRVDSPEGSRRERILATLLKATGARSDRAGGSDPHARARSRGRSGPGSRTARRTADTRALARAGTRDARVRAEQVARELAESRPARLRFRYFIPRPGCSSSQGATASAFANRSTLTGLMFRCTREAEATWSAHPLWGGGTSVR